MALLLTLFVITIDDMHPNRQSHFGWQGEFRPLQSPKAFHINVEEY